MKAHQAALCGVSISLAVALYVVVRRSHRSTSSSTTTTTTTTTKTTTTTSEKASFLQKDETLEAARIASDQEFADGCTVKVHGHGRGKVLHFIPQSKSYKVELHEHGKTQQKTVPAIHISHIKVKDFFIYPIKSCRGIRLDHAQITARGIANDRVWMLVDSKGKFITQRRYPTMALIAPQLDDMENPTVMTLTAPGMEDLRVPILLEGQGQEMDIQVWRDKMVSIDQGDAAAAWFNKYLTEVRGDREFRFVRMKDSFSRPTDPKFAPDHETVFADGFPFLLAVDVSINEINDKLTDKITMDRFRPNIVLTGAPAFADEEWNSITIGGLRFRNVKPCSRCSMPTVDQDTGVAHPDREPQRTMTTFRNAVALGFKNGGERGYYFGSNMVAEDLGTLSVGAPVKVLTTKEAVYA